MNNPSKLILASKSPYKCKQLDTLQLAFERCDPDVNEDHNLTDDIEQLALQLSLSKAQAALEQHPNALIIGSDQTAVNSQGELLTKPGDFKQAKRQLQKSSGRDVVFYSAVTLLSQSVCETWSVPTTVSFRSLSDTEIDRYLEADQPFDCAGSFKVESLGITLFKAIQSTDPSALVGLPLISLSDKLRTQGFLAP